MYFSTIPAAIAHVNAKRLRALAVTTKNRVDLIPTIPTVAESGLPGFEVVGWFGIFAPAGTPKIAITRLNKELNIILKMPDMRQQITARGLIPGGGSPEQLGAFLRAEIATRKNEVPRLRADRSTLARLCRTKSAPIGRESCNERAGSPH
jgi:tripartite-type tricarboxylate transporter receptor subunit TctC